VLTNSSPLADSPTAPRRSSRANDVYQQLKADIASFTLLPGDRFSENELCARLNVSRTPVRQALVRLQQEGYVEVQFRSGWRVLPFNFEQFEQLYDLRQVLEVSSVQRLCSADKRTGSSTLAQLSALWLVPLESRSDNAVQVSQWDEEFHCALVSAAGNAETARVHRDVTERIRILRRLDFTKQARIDATYDEHAEILRAILAKRADQATLLLRAHIQTSQAEVKKITLHQVHEARSKAL
jgi:DNA-binding GntR family transcriptional regulator